MPTPTSKGTYSAGYVYDHVYHVFLMLYVYTLQTECCHCFRLIDLSYVHMHTYVYVLGLG